MTDPISRRVSFTFGEPGADFGMIPIDFDQRAVFGRARPPVIVEINGYRYRSTIAIMRGETFVPLRRSHREAAGIHAGDVLNVTLTLDTEPRTVDPPADLAAAIEAAGLRAAWNKLSHTGQRECAESVSDARKAETRQRRIAATLALLAG
ncbi:MAG TPA: YdeI/OmpD-associated family protein [Sphingomonas sp.]